MREALPGDLLLRPLPIAAGLLLALNDHVLKANVGGWLTGKLSDAAGLVFVPLLLLGLLELGRFACRLTWSITYRDVVIVASLVAGALVTAKLSVPAAHLFGVVLGAVTFPFRGRFGVVAIAHDPSDLLMLPAVLLAAVDAGQVIRLRTRLVTRGAASEQSQSVGPTSLHQPLPPDAG
jgi:hypothetical protein